MVSLNVAKDEKVGDNEFQTFMIRSTTKKTFVVHCKGSGLYSFVG